MASKNIDEMKLYNFYLDELTKLQAQKKLIENGCDTLKGSLSALIRVLLRYYIDLIPDDPTFEYLTRKVQEEYLYTTKKNKRSKM